MKTSKAFRLAQKELKRRMEAAPQYSHWICYAIHDALPHRKAQKCVGIIMDRLHPRPFLGAWLQANITNFDQVVRQMNAMEFVAKLNETRLRWLDALIAEFEAKGD